MLVDFTEADTRLLGQVKGAMALLQDFKLDGDWLRTASNVVLRGVVGYYGRSRGVGEELSDKLEVPRRKVVNKGWKRSRNAPNAQLYADWSSGGHNMEHVFRVAMGALVDQIRKALVMLEDFPVKVVARAALAQTCWSLGCRVHPFKWKYQHVVKSLDVDWVMEAFLLFLSNLGWEWDYDDLHELDRDDPLHECHWPHFIGAPLWENEDVVGFDERSGLGLPYKRELAILGVVGDRDFFDHEGDAVCWKDFKEYWAANECDKEAWQETVGALPEFVLGKIPVVDVEGPGELIKELESITKVRLNGNGKEYLVTWIDGTVSWEPKAGLLPPNQAGMPKSEWKERKKLLEELEGELGNWVLPSWRKYAEEIYGKGQWSKLVDIPLGDEEHPSREEVHQNFAVDVHNSLGDFLEYVEEFGDGEGNVRESCEIITPKGLDEEGEPDIKCFYLYGGLVGDPLLFHACICLWKTCLG